MTDMEKKVMVRLCAKIVAETDLYETDKEVQNLIDWVCWEYIWIPSECILKDMSIRNLTNLEKLYMENIFAMHQTRCP